MLRLGPGKAAGPATRFLPDMPLPKATRERQKKQPPKEIVSCYDRGLRLTETLQSFRNTCSVSGKVDAINVARSRKIHDKFLMNASRMRRKKQNTISQTRRFANVA